MQKQQNSNSLPSNENPTKLSFNVQEPEKNNSPSNISLLTTSIKKQNICEICNKSFSTLGNMRNHIMTIHNNIRPFICTFPGCNKKYSIESRYQVHLRTHLGNKPFICQICNKAFNEKGNLKTHLRFHSELRPFKCPHCTKSYKTNGHLKDHIEIQHNLIKKYDCQYCHKKFGRISTLKAHIRTHTGEKNYKCKMEGCNKWFAEKGNMEIHYSRHLKKLNKTEEIDEKKKKKYGQKTIEKENEEKIKEAIEKLKDVKNNLDIIKETDKVDFKKSSNKKINKITNNNNTIFLNVNNNENINIPKDNLIAFNFVNNGFVYKPNINNINILNQNNDKINNFRIINENNFNTNINNFFITNFNNISNNEYNFVNNIGNEPQNFFGCLNNYSLIQGLHPMDEINMDISNSVTRPNSNVSLIMNKKADDIFPKEEELFSVEEDFSKNNNKNINENLYQNDNNINMPFNQNYDLLENQPNFLNEERMNNFNENFNELNEAKNASKYQEQIRFFDKNYIY